MLRAKVCRLLVHGRDEGVASRQPRSAGCSLTRLISAVNDELCEEADAGMFVTLLIGILDTETGEIEYCNAGHLPPFLLQADGAVGPLDGGHSPALALGMGLEFPTASHKLDPGDVFSCTRTA